MLFQNKKIKWQSVGDWILTINPDLSQNNGHCAFINKLQINGWLRVTERLHCNVTTRLFAKQWSFWFHKTMQFRWHVEVNCWFDFDVNLWLAIKKIIKKSQLSHELLVSYKSSEGFLVISFCDSTQNNYHFVFAEHLQNYYQFRVNYIWYYHVTNYNRMSF